MVLVLVLVLLQSNTTHGQELAFLNKFYFPISDTTKFKPKFYQQSLDRRDSLIVGIYTMDHMLAMRKVVYYDKDNNEISRKEFQWHGVYGSSREKTWEDYLAFFWKRVAAGDNLFR